MRGGKRMAPLLSVKMEDICERPFEYAVEPFHIAGNLYYVGNSWVSVYLIDTGEGLILIDTAMPQTVYLTLEGIRSLGFNPKDIRLILLSHAHYDHCGGARLLAEYTGARVLMGKEDMFFLTERPELIHAVNGWNLPFYVDECYGDGKDVELGTVRIETRHCPGHTPGTYSFFFHISEGGKTYRCGMHGGLGINTLTDGYLEKMGLPKSLQDDFEENLRIMREEQVDIPLGSHTNHGDMLGKARRKAAGEGNPFIDPEGFRRVIDGRYEDFLQYCHRTERRF